MSSNLLYFSPISRKTVSIELEINENIDDLYRKISLKESIPEIEFKLYSNGKRLETTKHLRNDSIISVTFGLNGGKGGFGSMLRAIGAQIEKTTNREACRDLTGRRLRDINEEKRIKEWIKKEKIRKEEMELKRRQKLEKLAKRPNTEFNDLEFERTRSEIPDIVDEALQYGLQVQQRQEQSSSGLQVVQKRKSEPQLEAKKRKKVSILIGVDDIDDDSDSCDDLTVDRDLTQDESTEDSTLPNDYSNKTQITAESTNADNESEVTQTMSESSNITQTINQSIDAQNDSKTAISSETYEMLSEEVQQNIVSESKDIDSIKAKAESESHSSDSKDEEVFEPLNLMDFESAAQLESLGLDRLKHSLTALGLKCGGSLNERANRLWSIRGLDIKLIPKKLFAKRK